MKQCRTCKQINVREVNGIAVSKWCTACRKTVEADKKEKLKAKKLKLKELKIQKDLAKKERKLSTKKHLKSKLKTLKAKCWKGISAFVRSRDQDFAGYVSCYTCGVSKHWKEMHCGHYIHGKLDFDLRNLKTQCNKCNTYLSGNLGEYTLRLIKENSLEWVDQLKLDANTTEYTIEDLEAIYIKYKEYVR